MDLKEIEGAERFIYKSGKTIIAQGQSTENVYYLSGGSCFRTRISEDGNESVSGIRHSTGTVESVLGLLTVIDGNDSYPSGFVALTECECYRIPAVSFLKYLNDHVELLYQIIRFATGEYRSLMEKFNAHSENSISVFICGLIYELSEPLPSGKRRLSTEYSNDFLSKLSGVTPVTTARIMSYLKERNIVHRTKNGLIVDDAESLRDYAEGREMKYRK